MSGKDALRPKGLKALKTCQIHKSHPQTITKEVRERVLALALEHPSYAYNRLEKLLALEGHSVSNVTIQKILIENHMGSRYERWLALEQKSSEEGTELSVDQITFLEKLNPSWKERHIESARPGELLSEDTFFVGRPKGVGRVYMHTVVDTYGSFAFGFLHTTKGPEAAVAVLHNEVLPFFKEQGIPVKTILMDNGREFCGTISHPYEVCLELNNIEHKRAQVSHPQRNGFVKRFSRTAPD